MKAAVLSAGSWGTALASVLCNNGHDVTMWGRSEDYIKEMQRSRKNTRYLKHFSLPENLKLTADIAEATKDADLTLFATPTQYLRETLNRLKSSDLTVRRAVNVSKGIEVQTLKRISEIFDEFQLAESYTILAGPSHAEEVVISLPTAVVAASENQEDVKIIQSAFMNKSFRVYSSDDVTGVELGGALKNIFAIAAGMIDGMGLGDNSKAALMTRGIVEMARLGKALGGNTKTFNGLSGIGDLIATCTSKHSRNRFVGENLGKGMTMTKIQEEMGHSVAEGVKTSKSAWNLSCKLKVNTPIIGEIYSVLHENKNPKDAVLQLMNREAKDEM